MNILGIESSCDETAAAIVRDGREILSNVVVSQIDIFKAYGGVIPEVAARSHLEAILPVIHRALDDTFPDLSESDQWANIDAISVTHTPGLLGSLLIGTLAARTLAILHDKPFYPVHHLKSHIYACWLDNTNSLTKADMENVGSTLGGYAQATAELKRAKPVTTGLSDAGRLKSLPTFPLLALVISGGHTQIIRMIKHNDFKIIGTTRDDAVGECFDKVAKILGLPYPGGPAISSAALGHIILQSGETYETTPGDRHKYRFPHPKLTNPPRKATTSNVPSLDFSFSGLKTAVLRAAQAELNVPISFPSHNLPEKIRESEDPACFIADFAASFEQTAIDILLENLHTAQELYPNTKTIVLAGGVSANELLRKKATQLFEGHCAGHDRSPLGTRERSDAIAAEPRNDGREDRGPTNTLRCFLPSKSFSGDNAAMVASAAYYEIESGVRPSDPYSLTLLPRSPIS